MSKYFLIIISIIILSCNTKNEDNKVQKISNIDSITKVEKQEIVPHKESKNTEFDSIENRMNSLKNEFKTFKVNTIKDTIKVDLNGDKITDFAFFKNGNNTRELFILDGKTKQQVKFTKFDNESDFRWVDFWGITEDKETFEVVINDSEIVGDTITKLINKSIFVRKEEAGGGVITFKNNRYIWIHQSD